MQKNDEDVLKLSEDLVPAKAAERVAMDVLAKDLKEMKEGIELVKEVVTRNMPEIVAPILQGGTKGKIDVEGAEVGEVGEDGDMEGVVKSKGKDDSNCDRVPILEKTGREARVKVGADRVQAEKDGGNDDDSFKSCVSVIEEKGETGVQDSNSDSIHGNTNGLNKFRSGWSSTPKLQTGVLSEDKFLGYTALKVPNQVQMLATSEMSEDELLGYTPMGRFSLIAATEIQALSNQFDDAQGNFTKLLQFFGEDNSMTPEHFFCTINTFVSMFDQTHKELKRKHEAKVESYPTAPISQVPSVPTV